MTSLDKCLQELTDWMADHYPSWAASLYPGITDREFDRLVEPLLPYRLPREVYTLYRWRNGQSISDFLPGYTFLPLEEALNEYRLLMEYNKNAWNSLWFPLLTFEGDRYVVVCDEEQQESSVVMLSYSDDPYIYVADSSLEATVRTILESYQVGAYYQADGCWKVKDSEVAAIRCKYSPNFRFFLGKDAGQAIEGVNFYSKLATRNWPLKWKKAIGRSEEDYVLVGSSMSIAEFVKRSENELLKGVALQGQVVQLTGASEKTFIILADETGEVAIKCPLPVGRELRIRDFFEVEVCAQEEADFSLLEHTQSINSSFIATKIKFLKQEDD